MSLLQGIAQKPNGSTGSQVLVENTSNDFTGVARPEVQYTQGKDVLGPYVNTNDGLKPGQQQTNWIDVVANKNSPGSGLTHN
ncbi:hypothetical protein ACQP1O_18275 [Nocardia sp. CA-151230]|uniref:hypothetical protein n=1 Tax=Nocardia sp. CA-151230 TaxID=3239982 RepID=UPI003D8FB0F8